MTGSPMIQAFRIPDRMDYVKLPCVNRVNADHYEPQFLLDCAPEVRQTRSDILERTALAFRPDLLIVDKRAAGVDGELMATLRTIRRCALPTKIVVGIRDIIDEPEATRRSLRRARDLATIARYYDEVWIYGARSVFDAATEYEFPPEVTAKTHFCGYLKRPTEPRPAYTGPPRVLVTTGGGGDGTDLVTAYLEGLIALPRRVALRTTIVFGPQMPPATRTQLQARYGATTPCASSCRAASAPCSCRAASRCASNCCGPASSRRAACSTWSSRTRSCRTCCWPRCARPSRGPSPPP
ncbi:MAG: hypothetical protein DMF96_08155 [Acidobacteria bacterium]|nr:MAG: hypothetical protein DMF96_08155 [Acidobacteriota bacterium]